MLELRAYTKAEISAILKINSKQGITRKLARWGVSFTEKGRGNKLVITITEISNPFKVYCITELDFDAGADFQKVRNLYYYLFNDEEFLAMPDEVKEYRLKENDRRVTRQSIAKYIAKLDAKNLIIKDTCEYIYYFAYGHKQRITDRKEYSSAWKNYWSDKAKGFTSHEAIVAMRIAYGGVARKQPIPQLNGIYLDEINTLCNLIQESIEKEIEDSETF